MPKDIKKVSEAAIETFKRMIEAEMFWNGGGLSHDIDSYLGRFQYTGYIGPSVLPQLREVFKKNGIKCTAGWNKKTAQDEDGWNIQYYWIRVVGNLETWYKKNKDKWPEENV